MIEGGQSAEDLARQIRTELAERAPEGFRFIDHVVRQDEALQRLAQLLAEHPDRGEVENALRRALQDEKDGWVLLKLLELVERLGLTGTAPALMHLAQSPPGDSDRARFLSGRACEVLLKLPLDVDGRARANQICKVPLQEVARYRLGAAREAQLQRPRRIEWLLLIVMMALGLAWLLFSVLALERP